MKEMKQQSIEERELIQRAQNHADKQLYYEQAKESYIAGATSEHERMAELLKEAHETIGDLLLRINKKDELISEAHNSMISILKVCQSPTLTTHGLSNIDKAVGVVNQLRRELESLKSQQHENRRVL